MNCFDECYNVILNYFFKQEKKHKKVALNFVMRPVAVAYPIIGNARTRVQFC